MEDLPVPGAIQGRGAIALAAGAAAAIVALRLSVDRGGEDAVIVLLVIPIALVAMSFGRAMGAAAAAAAIAALVAIDLFDDATYSALAYASRIAAFVVAGPVIGHLADRAGSARDSELTDQHGARVFKRLEDQFGDGGFNFKSAMALLDARSGRILRLDPVFLELCGHAREELLRMTIWDLVEPRGETTRDELEDLVAVPGEDRTVDVTYIRKDGSRLGGLLHVAGGSEGESSGYRLVRLEAIGSPVPCGEGSEGLTDRELEVLRLVAEGHSGPSIATRLYVSPETVKSHLKSIYRKLDVADRAAAVAVALRRGLID